eukprot:491858-Amphidinium_carterae.1
MEFNLKRHNMLVNAGSSGLNAGLPALPWEEGWVADVFTVRDPLAISWPESPVAAVVPQVVDTGR